MSLLEDLYRSMSWVEYEAYYVGNYGLLEIEIHGSVVAKLHT